MWETGLMVSSLRPCGIQYKVNMRSFSVVWVTLVLALIALAEGSRQETVLGKILRMKRQPHGQVRLANQIGVNDKVLAECTKKKLDYNENTHKCCPTTLHVFHNGHCISILPIRNRFVCPKGKVMNWIYHSCVPDKGKAAKRAAEQPVYNRKEKKYMKKIIAKDVKGKAKKPKKKMGKKEKALKKKQLAAFKKLKTANKKKT